MFRIALVGPEIEENLSLRYLASSLALAGFRSEIIPFNTPADLAQVAAKIVNCAEPPGLVGLSLTFQRRAKDFLALAIALRRKGYDGHITGGGHFATFACREILRDFPEIDSICRNEAEETLAKLAQAIAAGPRSRKTGANGWRDEIATGCPRNQTELLGQVAGLAYRDERDEIRMTGLPALPGLHTLPPPDRRGVPAECLGHRMAPLVASRGCYGNCTFCCISAWHQQTQPGKRFRVRPVEHVAEEMAALFHQRQIEIFTFHDDNFFLPNRSQTLQRIHALGDQLDRRGVHNLATIVKARPNDLNDEVVAAMRERLGLIRVYVGIETDSDQGLLTLRRHVERAQNQAALELVERFGIYACFNLLVFDPSTRVNDLETNLEFMERFADVPQNFGRVELYAGTPLLASMQAEGRCTGDYLDWDYCIANRQAQRVFELAMQCFFVRNFSDFSAANLLKGTRFVVEVAKRFHPHRFRGSWMTRAKRLSRDLTADSIQGMREMIAFVRTRKPHRDQAEFISTLTARLRSTERKIHQAAMRLEAEIRGTIQFEVLREPDPVRWRYPGQCRRAALTAAENVILPERSS